jgi:phosphate:Na+ symporter
MGILLTMMAAGIVTNIDQAIFIVYGLNIGTCITAVIATIKSSRAAKQAAAVHVIFNVIGATIFTIITILPLGFTDLIKSLSPNVNLQLVYVHIIFNVVTTLILLPLSAYIIKLAKFVVSDDPEHDSEHRLKHINRSLTLTPDVAIKRSYKEINRMADITFGNYKLCVITSLANRGNRKAILKNQDAIADTEEVINYLKKEINDYLMSLNTSKLDNVAVEKISTYYKIVGYLERIGDLSEGTYFAIEQYLKNNEHFSRNTLAQVKNISKMVEESLSRTLNLLESGRFNKAEAKKIEGLKRKINAMADLDTGAINDIVLIKILNNLARISGHSLNIARLLGPKLINGHAVVKLASRTR